MQYNQLCYILDKYFHDLGNIQICRDIGRDSVNDLFMDRKLYIYPLLNIRCKMESDHCTRRTSDFRDRSTGKISDKHKHRLSVITRRDMKDIGISICMSCIRVNISHIFQHCKSSLLGKRRRLHHQRNDSHCHKRISCFGPKCNVRLRCKLHRCPSRSISGIPYHRLSIFSHHRKCLTCKDKNHR